MNLDEAIRAIVHQGSVKEAVELLEMSDEKLRKLERKAKGRNVHAVLKYARALHKLGRGDELDEKYWHNVQRRNPNNTMVRAYFINATQDEGEEAYNVVTGYRDYRTYESNVDHRESGDWEEVARDGYASLQDVIDELGDQDYLTHHDSDRYRSDWESSEDEGYAQGNDNDGEGNWMESREWTIDIRYATSNDELLYADIERFNTFLEHRGNPYTEYAHDWPHIDPTDPSGRRILRT